MSYIAQGELHFEDLCFIARNNCFQSTSTASVFEIIQKATFDIPPAVHISVARILLYQMESTEYRYETQILFIWLTSSLWSSSSTTLQSIFPIFSRVRSCCVACFHLVTHFGDKYLSLKCDDGNCLLARFAGLTSDLLRWCSKSEVSCLHPLHKTVVLSRSFNAVFLESLCHNKQFLKSIRLKRCSHTQQLLTWYLVMAKNIHNNDLH